MDFPNPDGTITRKPDATASIQAKPNPNEDTIALSKGVTVNKLNSIWVRIFFPHHVLNNPSSSSKLPLIIHFHGGGFILLSAASASNHEYCQVIAAHVPAVVVTTEYRLAPKHRLPAAYDDAMEVLHWIKKPQDDWLQNYADLSCCYLTGDSAGGNLAHHAGLRASDHADNCYR